MDYKKVNKLRDKIKDYFESEQLFSMFEEAIDESKKYFIIGGAVAIIGGIIFGFTPPILLFGGLVSIFSPIISLTFSRFMQQFYKDKAEVLRDKLYKLEETVVEENTQKETITSLVKKTHKNKSLHNSKIKKYFNKRNIKEIKEQDDSLEK